MSIVRYLLVLSFFVFLSGCGGDGICSRSVEASSHADTGSSAIVEYCNYKESLDRPGPPLGERAKPLGLRGKDAVELWIKDMETGDGLYKNWEYGPILFYARDSTGYEVCSDRYMWARAKAGLHKYYTNLDDTGMNTMLAPYCQ